jgi:predicted nuclease of predicted toxin-antitoxin system
VSKFLLDENLAPDTARHLERLLAIDVVPLRSLGRTGIKDPGVLELAVRHRRVLITRDSDFVDPAKFRSVIPPGILWLHPSKSFRSKQGFKQVLEQLFTQHAKEFDLERSVVEVNEYSGILLYARLERS